LQVAYGNALIQARGYAAEEATEAFARAREQTVGDERTAARLAADYCLWVGSYIPGELPKMRAHAATFLHDVEVSPDSPEAGVAYLAAGVNAWFAGEFAEARVHLKCALSLFEPGRDGDLAFRFGQDAGVTAMANLAHVLWPIGDIRAATALVERMLERTSALSHVRTHAFARLQAAIFELMRRDATRAAPHASELAHLAREHGLDTASAFGTFLEGWVSSETEGGGLEAMRRGARLLHERNVLMFDDLVKIALAEAEASAGDLTRAVAILAEALATCDREGFRAFEAELLRARGEMLLRPDAADPAGAEEAFKAVIGAANKQGARSFALRAALAFAKLYHSIGRPAEAYSALAPATEAFTPTAEMREIAEAQALLGRLAHDVEGAVVTKNRPLTANEKREGRYERDTHRHLGQAQGRHPLHHRQGPLRRRHQSLGPSLRLLLALPACARENRQDRDI
jgi:predicted ATPase